MSWFFRIREIGTLISGLQDGTGVELERRLAAQENGWLRYVPAGSWTMPPPGVPAFIQAAF